MLLSHHNTGKVLKRKSCLDIFRLYSSLKKDLGPIVVNVVWLTQVVVCKSSLEHPVL